MKRWFLLFAFLYASIGFSQSPSPQKKPPIEAYKIISAQRDTTFVDTTLNIYKKYRFNYLRKDNFGLLQFSNVGQTYNSLFYSFDRVHLKPLFGARARHFNYREAEEVNYYHVPTPLTELYFKTAYTQGQQLDAFFTVNTRPNLNFSISYKGVRSLGKYQHILTSTGNFLFTSNYHTSDKRYRVRGHLSTQDLMNQENGGLRTTSLPLFINNDPEFRDRGRLDVNFEDADNKLKGLRLHLDQRYYVVQNQDSLSYNSLYLGNILNYENKSFEYGQRSAYEGLGPSYVQNELYTKTRLRDFSTRMYAGFDNSLLGDISAWIDYSALNYGYNTVLNLDSGLIPNRIKGNIVSAGGGYKKEYKGFELEGKGAINVNGDFQGNYLEGAAGYRLKDDMNVKAFVTVHTVAPNYNFLLHQNDYKNYNWKTDFSNVKTQELRLLLETKRFGNASVSYTGIDDYAYFGTVEEEGTPRPMQSGKRVNYLKVKAQKEFTFGYFGSENSIMYQEVLGGEAFFHVPKFLTRNSIYFQNHFFRNALFLQTGATFQYFTKFYMNAYDPVLAEFYVQNEQKLGGFPLLDLFVNAKIQQTRIYFIYENVTALLGGKNHYFAAPGYPYRDPAFRFGLVWNFFM